MFPPVGAGFLGARRTGRRARRRDAVAVHRGGLRRRAHPSLRRAAAADHRRLDRLLRVSVLLLKRSVLTEKIARRGYHLSREYDVDPLEILFAGEVMERDVLTFEATSPRPRRSPPSPTPTRRTVTVPPPDAVSGRRRRRPAASASSPAPSWRPPIHHAAAARSPSASSAITDPVVTHPDETLRTVATTMAGSAGRPDAGGLPRRSAAGSSG